MAHSHSRDSQLQLTTIDYSTDSRRAGMHAVQLSCKSADPHIPHRLEISTIKK